jgi:5-methylcytosine-specific restriction endonuclease McrA
MSEGWSEVRLRNFIISALRSATRRYPPKYLSLQDACIGKKINPKTKRLCKFYKCNACKKAFPTSEVQVDHIEPVVGPEGFIDWNTYVNRMFCPKENFQVVCKPCHKKKTLKETKERANVKSKRSK